MRHHFLIWKPVKCKNIYGEDYSAEFPELVDRYYRRTLLSEILNMPKKNSITFPDAIRMLEEKYFSSKIGHGEGEKHWYVKNFVSWISDLGYHIEMTGDEFEAVAMASSATTRIS